ncbi:MAG: hypothetical protein GC200_05315 [Tepidisphaera sp.]|nr:hypothetical protein [Tepidisphaera sp.]
MPFTPVQLAFALGLPLALCLVGFFLFWRKSRSEPDVAGVNLVWPRVRSAALVGVLLPGAILLAFRETRVPPVSAVDWPPVFAAAGGLAGVIGAWLTTRGRTYGPVSSAPLGGLILFGVLHVGLALLVAAAMHLGQSANQNARTLGIAAGIAVGGTLVSLSFRAAASTSSRLVPLLIVLVGVTSSVAAALTGNIAPPLLYGTMCACVGPAFLVGLVRPGATLGPAFTSAAWLMASLCIVTSVFGETPWWCAGLNALAGVMVWASGAGPLAALKGWRSVVVRGSMVAAPGLAAVIVAAMNQPEPYY